MILRFDKNIQGRRQSDDYATPVAFYSKLNEEFHFTFDPCPLGGEIDGLLRDWKGSIFVNPPYSNIEPWIKKGLREIEVKNAVAIVFLLPVRSDTKYWHNLILPNANEIRFVQGRLNFNEMKSPAPFPVCLAIFREGNHCLKVTSYSKYR